MNDGASSKKRRTSAFLQVAADRRETAVVYLLEEYKPLIRGEAQRHLRERFRADGEELIAHLEAEVFQALPGLRARERGPATAWLKKLVHSRIVDWERARNAKQRRPDRPVDSINRTDAPEPADRRSPSPSFDLRAREEDELRRAAIEKVPERYRGVLRFVLENAPTTEEIERFVGKPPEAARKFVERASRHYAAARREAETRA